MNLSENVVFVWINHYDFIDARFKRLKCVLKFFFHLAIARYQSSHIFFLSAFILLWLDCNLCCQGKQSSILLNQFFTLINRHLIIFSSNKLITFFASLFSNICKTISMRNSHLVKANVSNHKVSDLTIT